MPFYKEIEPGRSFTVTFSFIKYQKALIARCDQAMIVFIKYSNITTIFITSINQSVQAFCFGRILSKQLQSKQNDKRFHLNLLYSLMYTF